MNMINGGRGEAQRRSQEQRNTALNRIGYQSLSADGRGRVQREDLITESCY